MKKKFLFILFSVCFLFVGGSFLSACGEDPDAFVPYLEMTQDYGFEDVEVDTETKTISYTTKGKGDTIAFDSSKIEIVLHDSETTSFSLQYTQNEVVEEGQYSILMAEGIDFNLPGQYSVVFKTAYFGEQTYTIVCGKIKVALPTFSATAENEYDGRAGIEYTSSGARDVTEYLNDFDENIWTTESEQNKDQGQIGVERQDAGEYKVHIVMKDGVAAYYQTPTGQTEALVDWKIKRDTIEDPTIRIDTYTGGTFTSPVFEEFWLWPQYDDWMVYIGLKQGETFVKEGVKDAGEYTIGVTIQEDKIKNYCFYTRDENGNKQEHDVWVGTWKIQPKTYHYKWLKLYSSDRSVDGTEVVYNDEQYEATLKYTWTDSSVDYKYYDKENDTNLNVVSDVAEDAGKYKLKISSNNPNYAFCKYNSKTRDYDYYYYGDDPAVIEWEIKKKQIEVPETIYNSSGSTQYENGIHLTYTGEILHPNVRIDGLHYGSLEAKFEDSILYSENPYTFSIGFKEAKLKNYEWTDGTTENKGEYTYYIDQKEIDVYPFYSGLESKYEYGFVYPETEFRFSFGYFNNPDFEKFITFDYENHIQTKVGDYTAKIKLVYKNNSKESLKFYDTEYVDGELVKFYVDLDDEYEVDYTINKQKIFNSYYNSSFGCYYQTKTIRWQRVSRNRFGIFGGFRAKINDTYYGEQDEIEIHYDLFWDKNGTWEKTDDFDNNECNYKMVVTDLRYYYTETDYINPYENENFDIIENIIGKELIYNINDHPVDIDLKYIDYKKMDTYTYDSNSMRYNSYYDLVYEGVNNYHKTFLPQIQSYQEFPEGDYVYPKTLYIRNKEYGETSSKQYIGIVYEYYDENMNKLDEPPTKVGKYYQKATFQCPEGYFIMNGPGPILYEFNIIKTPVSERPSTFNLSWKKTITWAEDLDVKSAINVKYNYNHPQVYLADVLVGTYAVGSSGIYFRKIDKFTKVGTYYFKPVWRVKEEYADDYCVGQDVIESNFYDPSSLKFEITRAELNPLDYGEPVFGNEGNAYEFTYDGTIRTVEDFADQFNLTDTSGNFFVNRYLVAYYEGEESGYKVNEICKAGEYYLRFYVAMTEEYNKLFYFIGESGHESQGYNWYIDITIKPASALVGDCSIESEQTIVYDGENHLPVVRCKGEIIDVDYTLTDESGKEVDEAVNVGTYTFKVNQLKGNYRIEGEFNLQTTFEITHKTYDLSKLEWNYSGELDYSGEEVEIKLVDELDLEFDYAGNVATDAGDYVATATVKPSYLENANIIFTGEIESLSWKINKQDVNVATLEWNYETSFVYDGTEKVITIKNIYNLEIAYSENAKTDAGEYVATATITSTENANKNFNYIGTSFSLNWKILPQQIVFEDCVWDYQEEFVYDSTEKTVKLIGSYEFDYVDNAKTDAGQYTATATMIDERIGNKNYIIVGKTSYTISWTIEKVKIQIDDIEWNHPMALTYTGETYEFLPTNLPEFATYTISGNVATEPGSVGVILTSTNKNVVYCIGDTEFESIDAKYFSIAKAEIDVSGIQLKERFVEWYEGMTYQPEIDESTIPEHIDCQITSYPQEWWEGAAYVQINVWTDDPAHYVIKDSYGDSQTIIGRYVKVHGPIDGLFADWSAAGRVYEGIYPTNKFKRGYWGTTFFLVGSIDNYVDEIIITYTDEDGNVFNMDETPITELGFYTLHAELVSPLDLSGFVIEDFEVEIVKGEYQGGVKLYYMDGTTKVYLDDDRHIAYTGKDIELFAELEDGVDFEVTFDGGNTRKEVGEYNFYANITIVDEEYIHQELTEYVWIFIEYNPIKLAQYGNGEYSEYAPYIGYDLYYGFHLNTISSQMWWRIELNEGYSLYIDGVKQTPNENGIYIISSQDYYEQAGTARYVEIVVTIKAGDEVMTTNTVRVDTTVVFPGPGFDF